jgi:hypothetical protein
VLPVKKGYRCLEKARGSTYVVAVTVRLSLIVLFQKKPPIELLFVARTVRSGIIYGHSGSLSSSFSLLIPKILTLLVLKSPW